MYNQVIVNYIHEFINRSIDELARITNLYLIDIDGNVEDSKKRIAMLLKLNFGAFLGNYFSMLEEMIDHNLNENANIYKDKLHKLKKIILNQYRYAEIELQGGLSKTNNYIEFKTIMDNLYNELLFKIQLLATQSNDEVVENIRESFVNIQEKINAYLISIGITNDDLCNDIKQTIDIHQHNLLDSVDDKIIALSNMGIENVTELHTKIETKLSEIQLSTPTSTNSDLPPEIPMFKR